MELVCLRVFHPVHPLIAALNVTQGSRAYVVTDLTKLLTIVCSIDRTSLRLGTFRLEGASLNRYLPYNRNGRYRSYGISSFRPLLRTGFISYRDSRRITILRSGQLVTATFLLIRLRSGLLIIKGNGFQRTRRHLLHFLTDRARRVIMNASEGGRLLLGNNSLHRLLIRRLRHSVIRIGQRITLILSFYIRVRRITICVSTLRGMLSSRALTTSILRLTFILLISKLRSRICRRKAFLTRLLRVGLLHVIQAIRHLAIVSRIHRLSVRRRQFLNVLRVRYMR